jgi:hypothetical protein
MSHWRGGAIVNALGLQEFQKIGGAPWVFARATAKLAKAVQDPRRPRTSFEGKSASSLNLVLQDAQPSTWYASRK